MKFEFSTPGRILFGPGALQEVGALACSMGDRALVVTGRDERRAQPLRQLLREAGVASGSFPVPGEPTIPLADEAYRFCPAREMQFGDRVRRRQRIGHGQSGRR